MVTTAVAAPPILYLPSVLIGADAELGGKGAALDRMVAADFPVPPTTVVTAAAYQRFAADAGVHEVIEAARAQAVSAAEVDAAFLAAPLDVQLAGQILVAARDVAGGTPIAVRSSADAEDMAGLSFAGQYHSALGVDAGDDDAVLRAVRMTWASLWHPAPVAYRRTWGIPVTDARMSVVMMRMVDARMAGVTFTVDPAGDVRQMRVEAVHGLADGLVSGERTPQVWTLERDADPATAIAAMLPDSSALPLGELAELGRRAERLFGRPQDMEWAWDGTRVWVVQSRPITTGPSGDGIDSPPSTSELMSTGLDEMLPGVLPPLIWDLNAFLVDEALRRVFDDASANPAGRSAAPAIVRRVRGRAALDLELFKEVADSIPGLSADDLEREYFGNPASSNRTMRRRCSSMSRDLRMFAARRRGLRDGETVLVAVDELTHARVDVTEMDDDALLAYRLRLIDLGARAMTAELAVAAVAVAEYGRLGRFLERYLDDDAAALAAQQLTRLGFARTVPGRDLAHIQFGAGYTGEPRVLGDDRPPGDDVLEGQTIQRQQVYAAFRWNGGTIVDDGSIDDERRADPGAESDPDRTVMPGRGSGHPFANQKRVRVVDENHVHGTRPQAVQQGHPQVHPIQRLELADTFEQANSAVVVERAGDGHAPAAPRSGVGGVGTGQQRRNDLIRCSV